MKTLIVILGPTGVGKTELCIRLAQQLQTPIINADSRQLFAEIPIGTAAPTPEQQQRAPHFFVGTLHLQDYYSASRFEEDALKIINQQLELHEFALLSGGSMMYIDAVCNGIDDIPTINEQTRATMKRRLAEEGLPSLVAELKELDPEYWNEVDKNNPRRVVHALEICHQTGKTYTSFRKRAKKSRPFNIVKIGLTRPREELYSRINKRVEQMMDCGLEEEAEKLYPLRGLNSLNTVGYKEMFDYFDGKTDREEAIRRIQSNTRRYCRKQLTWFKRDDTIRWFHPENHEEIIKYIESLR